MSCIMGIVGASVFKMRNVLTYLMYFYYSLKYCFFLSLNFIDKQY